MSEIKHFYETFHPAHYDIFIDIDRDAKTISGTTKINGDAKEKTVSINQKYLNIKSVEADGETVPFKVDDENEGIHIDLEKTGETTLTISMMLN